MHPRGFSGQWPHAHSASGAVAVTPSGLSVECCGFMVLSCWWWWVCVGGPAIGSCTQTADFLPRATAAENGLQPEGYGMLVM